MLYKEYIDEAAKEVVKIYGPDAMGNRIEKFRNFFEDATISSVINSGRAYFSSASNIPTLNLSQALIGAGINKKGELPMGRWFITNELKDSNIENIIEEILNNKMKNLINTMKGGEGKHGVNRYLAENPKSDPNAYEIVDTITTYNNLVACGKTPPEDIKTDLDNMFSQRKKNFMENDIGMDNAAYKMCEFCYQPESLDDYPLPAVTIEAMKKIASLDLYSRQQERDGKTLFDNVAEVENLKNCFYASQIIKPGFLDDFTDDLNLLYNKTKENREKNNQHQLE